MLTKAIRELLAKSPGPAPAPQHSFDVQTLAAAAGRMARTSPHDAWSVVESSAGPQSATNFSRTAFPANGSSDTA